MSSSFFIQRGWILGVASALIAGATTARTASAQNIFDQKGVTEIRKQFLADLDSVHVKIVALAETIPEGKYGWSSTPETRTVANALMHVATEWYFYVPMVMGGKPPADWGAPREAIARLEKVATGRGPGPPPQGVGVRQAAGRNRGSDGAPRHPPVVWPGHHIPGTRPGDVRRPPRASRPAGYLYQVGGRSAAMEQEELGPVRGKRPVASGNRCP